MINKVNNLGCLCCTCLADNSILALSLAKLAERQAGLNVDGNVQCTVYFP